MNFASSKDALEIVLDTERERQVRRGINEAMLGGILSATGADTLYRLPTLLGPHVFTGRFDDSSVANGLTLLTMTAISATMAWKGTQYLLAGVNDLLEHQSEEPEAPTFMQGLTRTPGIVGARLGKQVIPIEAFSEIKPQPNTIYFLNGIVPEKMLGHYVYNTAHGYNQHRVVKKTWTQPSEHEGWWGLSEPSTRLRKPVYLLRDYGFAIESDEIGRRKIQQSVEPRTDLAWQPTPIR